MLQTVRLPQDENAVQYNSSGLVSGPRLPFKDSTAGGSKMLGPSKAAFADGTISKQPLSTRKALGNITNLKAQTSVANSGGKVAMFPDAGPSKGGKEGMQPVRRAFGDITNSVAPPSRLLAGGGGADSKMKPMQMVQPLPAKVQAEAVQQVPAPTALVMASTRSKAEQLASEYGVERLAGKGWKQLEMERLVQEEEGISRRIRAVATAMPKWGGMAGMFQDMHADSSNDGSDSEDEGRQVEPSLPSRMRGARAESALDTTGDDLMMAINCSPIDILPYGGSDYGLPTFMFED